MPEFVVIEHWFGKAENFAEAYTLYDEGGFGSGGFQMLLEVRDDSKFYNEEGEVM